MFKITFLFITTIWYSKLCGALPLINEVEWSSAQFAEQLSSLYNSLGDKISNLMFSTLGYITNLFSTVVKLFTTEVSKPVVKKVNGVVMRLNLVSLAVVDHYVENYIDINLHISAKTIVHLWQQLDTMEKIDAVLMNVTEELAINHPKNEDAVIMKSILINVERKIKEDHELFRVYLKFKSNVHLKQNSSTSEYGKYADLWRTNDKAFIRFVDEPLVRRMLLNKQFLINSRKHDIVKVDSKAHQRFVMANSILQLAKKSTDTDTDVELQNIYDEALSHATGKMSDFNNLSDDVNNLFAKLSENVDKISVLKFKLDLVKKDVDADTEFNYSDDLEFLLLL